LAVTCRICPVSSALKRLLVTTMSEVMTVTAVTAVKAAVLVTGGDCNINILTEGERQSERTQRERLLLRPPHKKNRHTKNTHTQKEHTHTKNTHTHTKKTHTHTKNTHTKNTHTHTKNTHTQKK